MRESERIWEEDRMCPLIRDVFVLYQDGALSEESEARVKEHLAVCGRCAKYYKMMKKSCRSEECAGNPCGETKKDPSFPPADRYEELARRLRRERRRHAILRGVILTAALAGGMALMYTAEKRREKTV